MLFNMALLLPKDSKNANGFLTSPDWRENPFYFFKEKNKKIWKEGRNMDC